jgi:hypothetical protein
MNLNISYDAATQGSAPSAFFTKPHQNSEAHAATGDNGGRQANSLADAKKRATRGRLL